MRKKFYCEPMRAYRLVKFQEWSDFIYDAKTPDAWHQCKNELFED